MQERQLGGYMNAEAEGRLIRKQVILSPVAVTVGAGIGSNNAEQTFTIAGVLAADFAVKGNPETAGLIATTPPIVALGGVRVSGISAIAVNYILAGTLLSTPTTSILYTFLIYRR